jgi:hypothetical protein
VESLESTRLVADQRGQSCLVEVAVVPRTMDPLVDEKILEAVQVQTMLLQVEESMSHLDLCRTSSLDQLGQSWKVVAIQDAS